MAKNRQTSVRNHFRSRWWFGWAFAASLVVLHGCEKPEIEQYKVKRAAAAPKIEPEDAGDPVRLLGAIFPRDDDNNFFVKLIGPPDVLKQVEGEFGAFVHSFRFADKGARPTWTVPAGWKPGKGNEFSLAAFMVGPEKSPVELTVSQAKGSLMANVDRWRGQIGLLPLRAGELGRASKQEEIGGATATLVDFEGKRARGRGMGPFGKGPPMPKFARPPSKPRLTAPNGWKEAPLKQFSIATYAVSEGNQSAIVTVTEALGELVNNINRWRSQLNLPPLPADRLSKELKPIEIDGTPAFMVTLVGEKESIAGAVVSHGGKTWFFKMIGDAGLVAKQQAAFEKFVQATRFDGAGHE